MGNLTVNDETKLDVMVEQVKNLKDGFERIEKNVEKVSEGMALLIEFRKEAEFLNRKIVSVEAGQISIIESVKLIQMEVSAQNARNRIFSGLTGMISSVGLAMAMYLLSSSGAFRESTEARITSMDKDLSVIKYQLAVRGTPPNPPELSSGSSK